MIKNFAAAILIAGSTLNASAQTYIQGGLNLANITKTATGHTEKNNMLTTFNAGILTRFNLSTPVDLESGILFTGHGSKAESYFGTGTDNNYVKTKFNPYYLELPLNVVFRFPATKTTNIFAHVGPYAAMGVSEKATTESNFLGATTTSQSNIKFSNDDPFTSQQEDAGYNKLKRFDLGMNFGGGLDLNKIIIRVNYGFGFTKINSTQTNNSTDEKNKYRTLSLSIGLPISREKS
ncbi:hypothetical protein BH09BAC2_BH09BAC2_06160 [soil metagenome]